MTLTDRERQVLRIIDFEPCPDNLFRREQPRLFEAGCIEKSPFIAMLGPAAGAHVLRLTEAGKQEVSK